MKTLKRPKDRNRRCKSRRSRRGGAIAEFALLLPILILLVLGTIDLGQYTNVVQIVNNASRTGALVATRTSISSESEIDRTVRDYLAAACPRTADTMTEGAISIKVSGADGSLPEEGLSAIESGAPISVEVAIDYSAIRWLGGLSILNNKTISSKTTMRKR